MSLWVFRTANGKKSFHELSIGGIAIAKQNLIYMYTSQNITLTHEAEYCHMSITPGITVNNSLVGFLAVLNFKSSLLWKRQVWFSKGCAEASVREKFDWDKSNSEAKANIGSKSKQGTLAEVTG